MSVRRCLRCGTTVKITVDHIVPKARLRRRGVPHHPGFNTQPLCDPCNRWKGGRRIIDFRSREEHDELIVWMKMSGLGDLVREVEWLGAQDAACCDAHADERIPFLEECAW